MECHICHWDIRPNMFKRHTASCNGRGPKYKRPVISEEERLAIIQRMKEERWMKGDWDEVPAAYHRDRLMLEQNNRCAECDGLPFWNGKPLKFQKDHIDGNSKNNSRLNLRMLCPNCHCQTDTWGQGSITEEGRQRMIEAGERGRQTQDRARLSV